MELTVTEIHNANKSTEKTLSPNCISLDFFLMLHKEHHSNMLKFAKKWVPSDHEAEDVVQDCFAKIWVNKLPTKEIRSWKSYLLTMVKNRCFDLLKQKKKSELSEKGWGLSQSKIDAPNEQKIIHEEDISIIKKNIALLPPRMQEVFQMYYFEEKSYNEIANILGTKPGTIRNQRKRAESIIRNLLLKDN